MLDKISIEYRELLTSEIVNAVAEIDRPHVFLWYIGTYGLKKEGVSFYKNSLLSPLINLCHPLTIWLVDLTAWGGFRNQKISIEKSSRFSQTIQSHPSGKIRSIVASEIFQRMQEIKSRRLVRYFRRALKRSFIRDSSKNVLNVGFGLGQVFSYQCDVFSEFFSEDAGKSYSIVQYFESFLLIASAVTANLSSKKNSRITNVVFVLPNDEIKYYRDGTNAFQKDLGFFLKNYIEEGLEVHVRFLSFKYGSETHHRPYNAPGKVFKKEELAWQDIANYSVDCQ